MSVMKGGIFYLQWLEVKVGFGKKHMIMDLDDH